MTLILQEHQIGGLLPMGECIAAIEQIYQELGRGEAQIIPRGRMAFGLEDGGH